MAPRRTQQQRVEESRRRLVAAAAELIAEGGYDAATAAEIGRRAGYSRSMVRARFGSKQQLIDAVIESAFEEPLTESPPESATGMQWVLWRIDTTRRLIERSPTLLRTLLAIEFQSAGLASGMTDRAARFVGYLRTDMLNAVHLGQRDGSIASSIDAEATVHSIVAEGVGSAFLWTVDSDEDIQHRLHQWRGRAMSALTPSTSD